MPRREEISTARLPPTISKLPTQGIIFFVHGSHFFIKLLHGSDVITVQEIEQGGTRRQFDKMKPGKKKEQFEQKHSAELALSPHKAAP